MLTVLIRAILMYGIILLSMKLMGKRQMGQMQVSEFITAIILSELAALPISDRTVPLAYCLVPLIVIISVEVILSFISLKSSAAQKFLESEPTVIVDKGKLNQKSLEETRITLRELLVELRIAGLGSISEAEYVYLEPNGKFSVIPKAPYRQATLQDLNITAPESEPDIAIILDGKVIESNLNYSSRTQKWLDKQISPHKECEVLLFCATRSGEPGTLLFRDNAK